MFGIIDLTTVCVIEDTLKFLAKNPIHLEFLLGSLTHYESLKKKISAQHIDKAIEFISNNKIHVAPYYEMDINRLPAIYVVCSGEESQQFIGDTGQQGMCLKGDFDMSPTIYEKWTASFYEDDVMYVAKDYNLKEKLWRNVFIVNEGFHSQLAGIQNVKKTVAGYPNGVEYTALYLKDPIPEGTDLTRWKSQSDIKRFRTNLAASVDRVTVQCKLMTSGDVHLHRILSVILRYCIKSNKGVFHCNHMYNPVVNYGYPSPIDEIPDVGFESIVSMEVDVGEHWIDKIYELPDRSSGVEVCLEADPMDTVRSKVPIPENDDDSG